jgi:hypothetical protein
MSCWLSDGFTTASAIANIPPNAATAWQAYF